MSPERLTGDGNEYELPDASVGGGASRLRPRRSRLRLPVILFAVTCVSTYSTGGWIYALGIMIILLSHEMGHFVQARRHGIPASLPYFIPMPLFVVGTMGAVIVTQPGQGNRKVLFDIAVTGPLAGLVPALVFCLIGLRLSAVIEPDPHGLFLGEPLLFQLLRYLTFGPLEEGTDVALHPLAFAGWVGVFITGLNLIPIGQLDGGHVLYALLRERAHPIAMTLLVGAFFAMALGGYWGWSLMFVLLVLVGPRHPPTANDDIPLGIGRRILGVLLLSFVIVGFTPEPFSLQTPTAH